MINLCFHGIDRPTRELEPGERPYWIAKATFLEVLDLVADRGDVTLSFDDGNASDVEIGLPALEERGLRASFFVLAGRLDAPGSLTRADVRALAAAGMTVGSHGMDHVPWRRLDDARARRELVDARALIAEASGRPVTEAACPLGRYDRQLLQRLRHLGYQRVYTSDRAEARPGSWLEARFSVTAADSAATVRADVLDGQPFARRARTRAATLVKRLR